MTDKKDDKSQGEKKPGPAEEETFVAGVAEGFVTTLIHPFRWFRSIAGKIK